MFLSFLGVRVSRACRRSVEGGRHGDGREGEDEGKGRPHSQARHERLHQQVTYLSFLNKNNDMHNLHSRRLPCRQLIYNYPEQLFADAGIMAIEHADFEGVERLALVTGSQLVCSRL